MVDDKAAKEVFRACNWAPKHAELEPDHGLAARHGRIAGIRDYCGAAKTGRRRSGDRRDAASDPRREWNTENQRRNSARR